MVVNAALANVLCVRLNGLERSFAGTWRKQNWMNTKHNLIVRSREQKIPTYVKFVCICSWEQLNGNQKKHKNWWRRPLLCELFDSMERQKRLLIQATSREIFMFIKKHSRSNFEVYCFVLNHLFILFIVPHVVMGNNYYTFYIHTFILIITDIVPFTALTQLIDCHFHHLFSLKNMLAFLFLFLRVIFCFYLILSFTVIC